MVFEQERWEEVSAISSIMSMIKFKLKKETLT